MTTDIDRTLAATLAELEAATAHDPSPGLRNVIDLCRALVETRRELAELRHFVTSPVAITNRTLTFRRLDGSKVELVFDANGHVAEAVPDGEYVRPEPTPAPGDLEVRR